MSWFGGAKDSGEPERGYNDSSAGQSYDSTPSGGGGGGGGGGGMADFQEFAQQIQQQTMIQQAITDMSDKAFLKCINSQKDSKLTGREVACVYSVTNKWLDTNEYMVGRLSKKGEQQQQQGGY
jgi:hypothetical protein